MPSTLTSAHAAVYAAVRNLTGFAGILPHEVSPDQMDTPTMLTVSTAGKSPTDYTVYARVWSSAATDQDGGAVALDALTEAVEAALPTAFVIGEWVVQYSVDHSSWVAESVVTVPRDDF